MPKELPRNWLALRRDWNVLTVYQRFEAGVAAILTVVIAMVILIALYRLIVSVIDILVLQTRNPLEHPVFQEVFGEILTLLIALEFNHTLQYVVTRERGIIQAKVVILIAQLALVRKIIVLDPYTITPGTLAALAALVIALAITYWLMRERDDRLPLRPRPRSSERSAESQ
jgi:uncharacterized membrane protein (DUF373 family)